MTQSVDPMATANQAFGQGKSWLPPGFRFHPTDEELVSIYLAKKYQNPKFTASPVISEADVNKCEPWDLPGEANMEERRYFYSLRDKKYPTGVRVNRATNAGYWKATGKDAEIRNSKKSCLLGMRKTLVFYEGRPPKGEKTPWVLHEYRMNRSPAIQRLNSGLSKDEWVICRIFCKDAAKKRTPSFERWHLLSECYADPLKQENAPQKCELPSNTIHQCVTSLSKPVPSSPGSTDDYNDQPLSPRTSMPMQTFGHSSNCAVLSPSLRMIRMPSCNATPNTPVEPFLEESAIAVNAACCSPNAVSVLKKVTSFHPINDSDLHLLAGQALRYPVADPLNNAGPQAQAEERCSSRPEATDDPFLISSDLCEKIYHPAAINRLGWCSCNSSSSLDLGSLWTF